MQLTLEISGGYGPEPCSNEKDHYEVMHVGWDGPRHRFPFFFLPFMLIGGLIRIAFVVLLIWLGLRLIRGGGRGPWGRGPGGRGSNAAEARVVMERRLSAGRSRPHPAVAVCGCAAAGSRRTGRQNAGAPHC